MLRLVPAEVQLGSASQKAMLLYSADPSFVDLNEEFLGFVEIDLSRVLPGDTGLQTCLRDYLFQPGSTELDEAILEFGEDIVFYVVDWESKNVYSHVGALQDVYYELTTRRLAKNGCLHLIEHAREAACAYTGGDLVKLEDRVERITKLCTKLKSLAPHLHAIVEVERELSILRRDAIQEPWSVSQARFSFGRVTD